jgi:RNA polymerase-binding transcription factor DksA
MTPISARKMALEARLAELSARLAGIERDLEAPHPQDWEDLATEREGDEVLETMGLNGQQEIRRVQAALARIVAGAYGTCVTCGAEISEGRLDAMPWTPFCRDCAA